MHTLDKGGIGITRVIADLTLKEYQCFLPIAQHLSFDLVVSSKNCQRLIRLQVKYRKIERGSLVIPLTTVHYDNTAKKHTGHHVDLSLVDGFGIYNPETDKCYYIPTATILSAEVTRSFMLRIDPAKSFNNCSRFAVDYLNPEKIFTSIVTTTRLMKDT